MFRPQRTLSFFLIGIFSVSSVFGQIEDPSFSKSLSLNASIHYGFYSRSNPKLAYLIDSHPFFSEVDMSTHTSGKKLWQQINGYPDVGLGLLYGNSGSREYLGKVGALLVFMKSLFFKSRSVQVNGEFGLGPGWIQKPFNVQTNFKNLVIGSQLNACIKLQATADIKLQSQTHLNIGFSFLHFSNGSIKLPNLGLNIPSLTIGMNYSFNKPQTPIKTTLLPVEKKWHTYLFILEAYKQAHPLQSPLCWVNLLSVEMAKNFSHTGRFGAGINLTYDRSLRNEIINSPLFAYYENKLKMEVSLYGSYEYVMGNLSIPFQVGVYLYNNYLVAVLYENIGVRYRLSEHWITGLALKAHFANGDFIQWGLGYKF